MLDESNTWKDTEPALSAITSRAVVTWREAAMVCAVDAGNGGGVAARKNKLTAKTAPNKQIADIGWLSATREGLEREVLVCASISHGASNKWCTVCVGCVQASWTITMTRSFLKPKSLHYFVIGCLE